MRSFFFLSSEFVTRQCTAFPYEQQTHEVKIHVIRLQGFQRAVQRNWNVLWRMVGVPAEMFQDVTVCNSLVMFQDYRSRRCQVLMFRSQNQRRGLTDQSLEVMKRSSRLTMPSSSAFLRPNPTCRAAAVSFTISELRYHLLY